MISIEFTEELEDHAEDNGLDHDLIQPFIAWSDNNNDESNGRNLPDVDDFREKYQGIYTDMAEFAREYAEGTGLLEGVPEDLARHFDYDSYGDELEQEYMVLEAPHAHVYIVKAH